MPTKKRVQLHISGLNMLGFCAAQFEARYVLGKKSPPGFSLLTGSATHRSIADDLSHKVLRGSLLPGDEAAERAADAIDKNLEAEGGLSQIKLDEEEKEIGAAAAYGEAKDRTVRLARLHHFEVAPRIRPADWKAIPPDHVTAPAQALSVNRRFAIDLDDYLRARAKELHAVARTLPKGYERKTAEATAASLNVAARNGIDLAGEQDIVEEFVPPGGLPEVGKVLAIRDSKTSKKSPNKEVADESDQLTTYALASLVLDGKIPDYVALDYLVDLKRGAKHVARNSVRQQSDLDVLLNRIVAAVHAIRTGVFVPIPQTDWRCSEKFCGYFSDCPYARKPRTVQVPEQLIQIKGAE